MQARDMEALREQNKDLTHKFKDLMSESRFLIQVIDKLKNENRQMMAVIEQLSGSVDSSRKEHERLARLRDDQERKNDVLNNTINDLKKENEQLRNEMSDLRNHSANLAIRLDKSEQPDLDIDASTNHAIEYLNRRSKGGIRPSYLTEKDAKVCMISSLPKSGTWSNQYFWSVFDSLCFKINSYDPYDAFFMRLDGFGVDLFAVAHFYCPGYRKHASRELLKRMDSIRYPCALNFDWGSKYLRDVGLLRACDPWENRNVKIAFIYRNPLDQVVSYTRALWDDRIRKKGEFHNVHDEKGNIIEINNIKEYIRTAGASSYMYYFMTYHMVREVLGERLLFVRYEEIIRDRYKKFRELTEFFLGAEFARSHEKELRSAEEITRIENMKLLEKTTGKTLMHNYRAPMKGGAHVHDGSIGQWKKVLDQEDVDFILGLLDDFGIKKDYFHFE